MSVMKETDRRFIGLEKKLGLFVVIALSGIILITAFLGIEKDLFMAKEKIFLIADSGKELTEGMAVKLSGFKIGKVKKLYLDDITRIKVELSILKNYMKWIKNDSLAKLVKEGIMGENIIEISPGSKSATPIVSGDTLRFERGKGLNEMADELKNEIIVLLEDFKEVIKYINNPDSDIKVALKNLNSFTNSLNSSLKGFDDALSAFKSLMQLAHEPVLKADNILNNFDGDYPQLIKKINVSLENIEKMTGSLRKTVDEIGPGINPVLKKSESLIDSSGEIMDAVKKMWPVSSNIESPDEKTLAVDSYE